MKEKIGFIGLGIMGGPMATNLINAGYELKVFDIRVEAMKISDPNWCRRMFISCPSQLQC